jgi:hypothetical protein
MAPYGRWYDEIYEEDPYREFFQHDKAGSRSYASPLTRKDGSSTGARIYMSTSDRHWDVYISHRTRTDGVPMVTALAKQVDDWLSKGQQDVP